MNGPTTGQGKSASYALPGCDDFVIAMAYGERPEFDIALTTVVALAEKTIQHQGDGAC